MTLISFDFLRMSRTPMTLPLELLTEIFKYNDYDYKTLYSCILVNKQWHYINIPILWENPFYSKGSIKIIINCLLEEDKDFLAGTKLDFKLLEKPPLYNYARFCTFPIMVVLIP